VTTYRVKTGHDQALVDLVDVSPQPTSPGIKPTRRTYAADGSVYDEARYVELEFSMVPTASDYQTMLAQFGLSASVLDAAVTVYVRNEIYAWVRMNGRAVRPEIGREAQWRYMPRNVTILVKDLEAAS